MYSLSACLKTCRKELRRLHIPVRRAVISENKRLKTTWGRCGHSDRKRVFAIEINSVLLDENNPESALKETVIHELLHTCPGCMNHGEVWQRYAARVNAAYGYHIKTTSSEEEKGISENRMHAGKTYQLRCECRGATIYRSSRCKVVRNPSAYACGKCGGKFVPINF